MTKRPGILRNWRQAADRLPVWLCGAGGAWATFGAVAMVVLGRWVEAVAYLAVGIALAWVTLAES